MTAFNPDPKKKRIELKGAAYTRLRWDAFNRAGGICEYCRGWAPFRQDGVLSGELSHDPVGRGAGGDDHLDNVKWACFYCHRKKHGPRWSKQDEQN